MKTRPTCLSESEWTLLEKFVGLHRELYDIRTGQAQPDGLGREWSELKQRVYGTFAYATDLGAVAEKELADPEVREATMNYILSKFASLRARVDAKRGTAVSA